MAPSELAQVLGRLPNIRHPDLIVGSSTGDDACVWAIDDQRCLVSSVDFITPIVDDARTFGQIAAANAVSDIFAMGAKPLFGLNIVSWNRDDLPLGMLSEVLLGGQDIASEAGFVIAGGHSIGDPEPKYGLAVTGVVDKDKMMTNAGLKVGQDLILTKPLGVGIVTTAIKFSKSDPEVVALATREMTRTNREASRVALEAGASGATDVTGFGLLGHLGRMALESGVIAGIDFDSIPVFEATIALCEQGVIPGGTRRNLEANRHLLDPGSASEEIQLVLADAQTSGGLIFGVDPEHTPKVLADLAKSGHSAAKIGRCYPKPDDGSQVTVKLNLG